MAKRKQSIYTKMLLIFLGCAVLFASTLFVFYSLVNDLKKIEKVEAKISHFHHQYLLQTLGMQRFMLHGYQDTVFLQQNKQADIDQFLQLLQQADSIVSTLREEAKSLSLSGTADSLNTLINYLHQLKQDVIILKQLYFVRGFKNYGLEGNMRTYVHALEKLNQQLQPNLLQLRRHEKDFLLRNEQQYKRLFDSLANVFERSKNLSQKEKQLLILYHQQFDSLAQTVNQIGNHQVSGKYQQTLERINIIQHHLAKLDAIAHNESSIQVNRFKDVYLSVVIVLILLLMMFTFYRIKQVAQDIVYLNQYIKGMIEEFLKTSNVKPLQPYELKPTTAESDSLLQSFNTLLQNLHVSISESNKHKSHLLAVIENTENGFCLLSENFRIIYSNDALKKLFALLNIPAPQHYKPLVEYAKPLGFNNTSKLIHLLLARKIVDYQQKILLPNKQEVWLHWKLFPILHSNTGVQIGHLVQVSDITKFKATQLNLSKSNTALKTYNNRLKNFAYIISHNLRSHSSNILSLATLIQQNENKDDEEMYIDMLAQSASMLISTITDLHETVSIQTTDITKTTIHVAEHIDRILLQQSQDIERLNAQIQVAIPPDSILNTNVAYFESIVWNLVSNALKYAQPNLQPHILISFHNNCLQVKDNGLGIDLKKHKDKIFGLYKTFHNNADARGMGLFITKNQVEALGAVITVDSVLNEGTTFKIAF